MITVGATILALFPLHSRRPALETSLLCPDGGPHRYLYHFALVPVFYSIFVLDLKWIKWETTENRKKPPPKQKPQQG